MAIDIAAPGGSAAGLRSAIRASLGDGVVNLKDFGAVGDGAMNNAAALNAFGTYARAESTAGRGVDLHVPPGTYNFNHSQCQSWLQNIKKLRLRGYGAIFQNTYDRAVSGDNFRYELPWSSSAGTYLSLAQSALINTVTTGQTTVTLSTPSEHSKFSVGEYVMICSMDIQMYGYPPNLDRFDFVKITAKNTSTGVLTFANHPLRYEHRSDFPDGSTTLGMGVGKARVFQINDNVGTYITWDVDHIYEGIETRMAPILPFPIFQSLVGAISSLIASLMVCLRL